ncbi:MAG: hypothetical protein QF731_10895 [Verrucomicrobiota bacterium]|nr:hypothetical protein [Verrucomicrobiota bacterium]
MESVIWPNRNLAYSIYPSLDRDGYRIDLRSTQQNFLKHFKVSIDFKAKNQSRGIEDALIYGSVNSIQGSFAHYFMVVLSKINNKQMLTDFEYGKENK